MKIIRHSPPKPTTFLDLPLELRWQIYELHFSRDYFNQAMPPKRTYNENPQGYISLGSFQGAPVKIVNSPSADGYWKLLLSNSQVYWEAVEIARKPAIFQFFNLPLDIRQRIYRWVFRIEPKDWHDWIVWRVSCYHERYLSPFWSTLLLNKQIYFEARSTAYGVYRNYLAGNYQTYGLGYECIGEMKNAWFHEWKLTAYGAGTPQVSSLKTLAALRLRYIGLLVDSSGIPDSWAMQRLKPYTMELAAAFLEYDGIISFEVYIVVDWLEEPGLLLFKALEPLASLHGDVLFVTPTKKSANILTAFLRKRKRLRRTGVHVVCLEEAELGVRKRYPGCPYP